MYNTTVTFVFQAQQIQIANICIDEHGDTQTSTSIIMWLEKIAPQWCVIKRNYNPSLDTGMKDLKPLGHRSQQVIKTIPEICTLNKHTN